MGSRLARHAEVLRAFRTWAGESPRVDLAVYGRTYEGRDLVRAIVSSEKNVAELEQVAEDLRHLADPRGLSDADAARIVGTRPAIAWMGYSIHGDETSGTDASLAVAHRLIAGRDPEVRELLERVVVVIDPCMNPDGRMRTVSQVEQNAGYVTNLDVASRHRGYWPFGRGNHYLFDMNRDWMAGVCPETRGRWSVAREFPPQLFVDAHEMGPLDTYLFYPQAAPLNPHLPPKLTEWQGLFAQTQSKAFDAMGWAYYTREWADAWCPFYSDAWGSLNGAIGMLYEQGNLSGQPLRKASGNVMSYRESVHGQVVSSMANLSSLARHREAVLRDYLAYRRFAVDPERSGAERAFVVVPGRASDREAEFVDLLARQGIEVRRASEAFDATDVESSLGEVAGRRRFPAGAWVISACQPLAGLVSSYLEFDARMDEASLQRERAALERGEDSKIYDVTAWDLGRAFDLDAYWCTPSTAATGAGFPVIDGATWGAGELVGSAGRAEELHDEPYAVAVDGSPDASLRFAARAMELGLVVHVSDKPFRAAGVSFERGSFLLRRHENPSAFARRVERAAVEAGVRAVSVGTGRAQDEGPDLGGGHFHLLERPRVAVVGGTPVNREAYGHAWHLLDVRLGLPFSILEAASLAEHDLRPYNMILLPDGDLGPILSEAREALAAWIDAGGLLVAWGGSAASLTNPDLELSSVVLRAAALDELAAYDRAAEREWGALDVQVDTDGLWGSGDADAAAGAPDPGPRQEAGEDEAALADWEAWARRFAPSGATLRGRVDPEHWITVGSSEVLPISFSGADVFLSKDPVVTPVRFADPDALRISGLLWPEARERLARSAYLTCERRGHGGLLLFASAPAFRGMTRATARLLANAIVLGPGRGAQPALPR